MPSTSKRHSPPTRKPLPHVALLRGVNVGGKHKLPMAHLAGIFTEAGCTGVRTYIQSGNVVFLTTRAIVKRIPNLVSSRIRQQFEFDAPVMIRTADEIQHVAATNPFLATGADERALHVVFLAADPHPSRVANLDPIRSPGDAFQIVGRQIFLHLPNGAARTKLTNSYFDTTLATVTTARNWRTVLKLNAMCQTLEHESRER